MKFLTGTITGLIDTAGRALDNLFTSDEERQKALNTLEEIKVKAKNKERELSLEFEKELTKRVEQRASIIKAEAIAESYIQRNWRPITMLVFTFIIANNFILAPYIEALFGVSLNVQELPEKMWNLLTIGMGGYIGALGVKKVVESSKWSK